MDKHQDSDLFKKYLTDNAYFVELTQLVFVGQE